MDSQHEERISQLLGELRKNESSSSVSGGSRIQASTSACRDWHDAPHEEQGDEHPVRGSYNGDEGMLGQLRREDWSETVSPDPCF